MWQFESPKSWFLSQSYKAHSSKFFLNLNLKKKNQDGEPIGKSMYLYTVYIDHKITKFLVRTKKINAENNLGSLIIQAFLYKRPQD